MGTSLSPRPLQLLLLLLLLLLGLSLLLGSLQALTCFKCDHLNATGVCERGEGSCRAKGSQQCFLRKVYEGGRFQYGYQGCRDLCISMTISKPHIRVDVNCCHGVSFCNRL